ncbi:hypothetical protein TSAR_013095 [Trichomalopsis sarcophagae]|uniref:JmjC domain-containing protein n=1 Tax=Trichomalopsis sarcophagae TaxID=543379 RepID=A0A232ESH8_9HYME|nr:hypothetical protein TSAR_013095 [Trichomalopsis sarcophagae]
MSAEHLDIVRYYEGKTAKTLVKTRPIIHNLDKEAHKSSVHVVIAESRRPLNAVLFVGFCSVRFPGHGVIFVYDTFSLFDLLTVHFSFLVAKGDPKTIISRILSGPVCQEVPPSLAEGLYDSIIERVASGELTPVYVAICATKFLHDYQIYRTNGISCQIIDQRPGDLVYVEPSVLDQVLNLGVNLAEAVNVGGSAWNLMGSLFTAC